MLKVDVDQNDVARAARIISELPQLIEFAAKEAAQTLRLLAQGGTPVGDDPKHSGTAKRAWSKVQKFNGGYTFGNVASYIDTLEKGLYPGVDESRSPRRTVKTGSGVFSTQAPEGILNPLLQDKELLKKIADQIVAIVQGGIKRAGA